MRRSHIDDKIAAMAAKGLPAAARRAAPGSGSGCAVKDRYPTEEAARAVALMNGMAQKLLTYRCEQCDHWHLSRRHKGP